MRGERVRGNVPTRASFAASQGRLGCHTRHEGRGGRRRVPGRSVEGRGREVTGREARVRAQGETTRRARSTLGADAHMACSCHHPHLPPRHELPGTGHSLSVRAWGEPVPPRGAPAPSPPLLPPPPPNKTHATPASALLRPAGAARGALGLGPTGPLGRPCGLGAGGRHPGVFFMCRAKAERDTRAGAQTRERPRVRGGGGHSRPPPPHTFHSLAARQESRHGARPARTHIPPLLCPAGTHPHSFLTPWAAPPPPPRTRRPLRTG